MSQTKNRHPLRLAGLCVTVVMFCGCDMIPGLGGDDNPVVDEVRKQAEELKTQADRMGDVAKQMKREADELKKQYDAARKSADKLQKKWETMRDQAVELKKAGRRHEEAGPTN